MTVDDYVSNLEASQRLIAEELRRIVKEAAPHARETIKWGMPVYVQKGNMCYISGMSSYVNLGFYRGADLTDPDCLLEGTGKKLRHVKVRSVESISTESLQRLVAEAVRVDGS